MSLSRDNFLAPNIEQAFSKPARDEIFIRDGGKSVLSGSNVNVEAAHISHDKSKSNYDAPSNGRLLTLFEHLVDHLKRGGRNGLSENHNNFAIRKIKQKLYEKYHLDGDP